MTRRSCDGAGLLASLRAAVAALEAHVDEVNGLNVFPVPDGDTGSNMLATVEAIVAAIGYVSEISVGVSSAITQQAAVTRDMSVNMQDAAHSVASMRRSMERITGSAGEVDASIRKVAQAARALL